MPNRKTTPDADLKDAAARPRPGEESAADKDAQIARLARELALTKKDAKETAARLSRQRDISGAHKDAQLAQCLHHLRRINASPWWRLGKLLEKLILSPLRLIASSLAGNRPPGSSSLCDRAYQKWIELYDTLSDRDRQEIRDHIRALDYQPLISILIQAQEGPEQAFRDTLESVRAQLYTNWELCVAATPSARVAAVLEEMSSRDPRIKWTRVEPNNSQVHNVALALAAGEFVARMGQSDILAEQALYEIAVELNDNPSADLVYSDEDKINGDGARHSPHFKTDWNPELFLGHDMISRLAVYRRPLVEKIGGLAPGDGGSGDYDLALRAAGATSADKIRHVPAVLYHRRNASGLSEIQPECSIVSAHRAKRDYFMARKESAEVERNPAFANADRIRRPLPSPPPLVSLIVSTCDRHDLLGPCMRGLLHRTTYQPIEVIIIDHQSDDARTIALLERLKADKRVRIIAYERPFNYSDMNNKAVAQARGEIIGLINNDIDVIEPDWLAEMVSLAVLPENGAIGAKLLYPSDRVQHGGIILGSYWGPDHAHTNAERDESGYFGRLQLTTNVSAVTGACLIIRKSLFEEVGGLNALDLPVGYNDVDLCLKIRAKGYRNVWTPFALLYHHEYSSRRRDTTAAQIERADRERAYMRSKWGEAFDRDPYFNVNLTLQNPSFALAFPPRRIKPWRNVSFHPAPEARPRKSAPEHGFRVC